MPFGKCVMPHHSAVACTRRQLPLRFDTRGAWSGLRLRL